MYITLSRHDRHQILEPLSKSEIVALLEECAHDDAPAPWATGAAFKLLEDIHEKGQWLACDCRHAIVNPPPMMVPVLRQGAYHLRRHSAEPHDSACPFYSVMSSQDEKTRSVDEHGLFAWTGDWTVLQPAGMEVAAKADDSDGIPSSREDRMPSLGRILMSVLTRLKVGDVNSSELMLEPGRIHLRNPVEHYSRLQRLEEESIIGDLKWREIATTFPTLVPMLMAKMRGLESRFPESIRPQAFFLSVVDRIEKQEDGNIGLVCKYKSGETIVSVHGRVRRFGAAIETPGPFIVLAVGAARKSQGYYNLVEAYAHPIYSKSILAPVDSQYERDTMTMLLDQVRYWASPRSKIHLKATLVKPLLDEGRGQGACRPDFFLVLPNGKRVVVECMGRDGDPAYLQSKKRTHPRMLALDNVMEVVEYWPKRDDDREWRLHLTGLVRKYAAL